MPDRDLTHPYDRGYWAAVDGKPRPADPAEQEGWDDCRRELSAEAWDRWDRVMMAGAPACR